MLAISWDNEVWIYSDHQRALLDAPSVHCISIVGFGSNISAGLKEIAAYSLVMEIWARACTKARSSFALFVLSIVRLRYHRLRERNLRKLLEDIKLLFSWSGTSHRRG
jgi:hypothetical protein